MLDRESGCNVHEPSSWVSKAPKSPLGAIDVVPGECSLPTPDSWPKGRVLEREGGAGLSQDIEPPGSCHDCASYVDDIVDCRKMGSWRCSE